MFISRIKLHMPSRFKLLVRPLYNCARRSYQCVDNLYTRCVIKNGPIKRNKILFDNFFGKGYGDNPKYIAEEIHKQGLNWDMVWLLGDMSTPLPPYVRAVPYGSNQAKRELATAKVVVNNVRNSMRMPKKKGQVFLQTWHGGLGFKHVEGAAEEKLHPSYVESAKRDGAECDAIISACALQTEDYEKHFWLNPKTKILEVGQPRCDILFSANPLLLKNRICDAFNIPQNAKIILYAPTFRDNGSTEGYALNFKKVVAAFEAKFNTPCVVIVRLHPNAYKFQSAIEYDDKVINGSNYPDIQELYLASSVLITDYSSSAFDCSLLGIPVFVCALDYEQYREARGISHVFDQTPFPKAYSNTELIYQIERYNNELYAQSLELYKNTKWMPYDDGSAAKNTVNWLRNHMVR